MFNSKNYIRYVLLAFSIFIFGFIILMNNQSLAITNYNNALENILYEADILKKSYYIDEAISLLNNSKYKSDKEVVSKVKEYDNYKKTFVKYEGVLDHIFFHSLIVYPQLAFDSVGHDANGYNMWFSTTKEFKNMLPLLQERGFVLVSTKDLFEIKDNEVVKKDLYLPPNKKPLIISQDDVNYYEYMKPDGFADKLVYKDNEIFTLVRDKNNNSSLTRDGDLVPILNEYIKENPEFSYKGAKGILGVTGYEGVFGYRLNNEENIKEAIDLSNKLKEDGWEIASHSYTHNGKGFFGENPIYDNLTYDFNKWNKIIRPIVGDTNLFISPFGVTLEGDNFDLVKSNGFDIYFPVCRISQTEKINNTIIMPRFNIDGFSMFKCRDDINKRFFHVDKVLDNSRPTLH